MRKMLGSLARELQGAAQGSDGGGGYGSGGFGGHPQQPGGGGGFGAGGYGFTQTPQVPQAAQPCPRQQPQAGHQDWVGLNDTRFVAFNVCLTCYNTHVRPTQYANAFVTKNGPLAVPPHVAVRCDMPRFWVRIAGMVLLTMNQDGRHDITLLARVAGIRAQEGDCPNAQLTSDQQPLVVARRTWYTILDPQTGARPVPGWTVCASCVLNMQACCPAIAAGFAPVQPAAGLGEGSCAMVPSDVYDDARTAETLQYVGSCALVAAISRRPDLSQLVSWLQINPPQPRGGGGLPSMGGAQPQCNGLCPRSYLSTTLRCHTMQGLFDFTVCEQCYADVIKPDADRGVDLARRVDGNPAVMPPGFTCQLYSDRMRQVWAEAASTGNIGHLGQKVSERRAKEREMQMKKAQFQQQANQLRQQARAQEQLAASAMGAAISRASNNIMVASVSDGYRLDSNHYGVPSGSPDFSQSTQMSNQASMLNVQAAQVEEQIRFAEEEWRRYWE